MNSQIKQRWIEALRYGEYEQTQSRLHTNRGYCCLGVLCDLYVKEHGLEWEEYEEDEETKIYTLNLEESILPEDVRNWAELNDRNPSFKVGKTVTTLARKNDVGYTFDQIAQLIEEQL
jgi:hypothetical protein